jgi:hypothetical protein
MKKPAAVGSEYQPGSEMTRQLAYIAESMRAAIRALGAVKLPVVELRTTIPSKHNSIALPKK